MLLSALGLFAAGLFAPLMELEKLWFFTHRFSLLSALQQLWEQHEFFLFAFLFLFSVLAPLLKVIGLAVINNSHQPFRDSHRRFLHFLEIWGKWSMLDVFVVTLFFVAVKLGALAQVKIHYGLYLFASSVILVQILSFWFYRLSRNQP